MAAKYLRGTYAGSVHPSIDPRALDQPRRVPGEAVRAALLATCLTFSASVCGQSLDYIQSRLDSDPNLEPLVPVLIQCGERRAEFGSDQAFFRSSYGASCASVLLSFGLVSEDTLRAIWDQP